MKNGFCPSCGSDQVYRSDASNDPNGVQLFPSVVALCQEPDDSQVYCCYCDASWSIIAQEAFASQVEAVKALELGLEGAAALLRQ